MLGVGLAVAHAFEDHPRILSDAVWKATPKSKRKPDGIMLDRLA
jgi:hypothetical protein